MSVKKFVFHGNFSEEEAEWLRKCKSILGKQENMVDTKYGIEFGGQAITYKGRPLVIMSDGFGTYKLLKHLLDKELQIHLLKGKRPLK